MSLEQEVEISASGFQGVIVDPDMKPEIKMEKQDLEPERQAHLAGHTEAISGGLHPPLQHIKQEGDESAEPQQWEAQWCNFLDTSPPLPLGQGLSELPEKVLQHGPKASPSILEGAEPMSDWAKVEKVPEVTLDSRDFRTPSGGSEEQTKYPKVGNSECWRQHFRQFSYREAEGPWEAYCQLRKLCYRWLMPERCTKEEMLELVILEQFLAILPLEMLRWIQERDSKSCFHAVALAERFLLRQCEKPDQQMTGTKQEGGVNFPEGKETSLDVTLRQMSMEVKQEEDGKACTTDQSFNSEGSLLPIYLFGRTKVLMLQQNVRKGNMEENTVYLG